jgi:hypothetical protein
MMLPHYRISALALSACLLFVLPGTGQAASADILAKIDMMGNTSGS